MQAQCRKAVATLARGHHRWGANEAGRPSTSLSSVACDAPGPQSSNVQGAGGDQEGQETHLQGPGNGMGSGGPSSSDAASWSGLPNREGYRVDDARCAWLLWILPAAGQPRSNTVQSCPSARPMCARFVLRLSESSDLSLLRGDRFQYGRPLGTTPQFKILFGFGGKTPRKNGWIAALRRSAWRSVLLSRALADGCAAATISMHV